MFQFPIKTFVPHQIAISCIRASCKQIVKLLDLASIVMIRLLLTKSDGNDDMSKRSEKVSKRKQYALNKALVNTRQPADSELDRVMQCQEYE